MNSCGPAPLAYVTICRRGKSILGFVHVDAQHLEDDLCTMNINKQWHLGSQDGSKQFKSILKSASPHIYGKTLTDSFHLFTSSPTIFDQVPQDAQSTSQLLGSLTQVHQLQDYSSAPDSFHTVVERAWREAINVTVELCNTVSKLSCAPWVRYSSIHDGLFRRLDVGCREGEKDVFFRDGWPCADRFDD